MTPNERAVLRAKLLDQFCEMRKLWKEGTVLKKENKVLKQRNKRQKMLLRQQKTSTIYAKSSMPCALKPANKETM